MVKDNLTRIKHMLDAAHAACSFVQNKSKADVETDLMLSSALIRQLEILGEAAGRVTPDSKKDIPSFLGIKLLECEIG